MKNILKRFILNNDAPVGLISLGIQTKVKSKNYNYKIDNFWNIPEIIYNNLDYKDFNTKPLVNFTD